jgi:hypothetical protein
MFKIRDNPSKKPSRNRQQALLLTGLLLLFRVKE